LTAREGSAAAKGGKTVRDDRLVAVAQNAHDDRDFRTLSDLHPHLLKKLEHFFKSYKAMKGRKFVFLGTRGPRRARKLPEAARRRG
jgi:inorganic pyrophosphatase